MNFLYFFKGMVESLKISSYITKTSSNCLSNIWIDDGDLGSGKCGLLNQPTESVKYSFKKKNRWNLPGHLSNEIKDFTSKKQAFADNKDSSYKNEQTVLLKRSIKFKPKYYSECTINQVVKSVQYSEEPVMVIIVCVFDVKLFIYLLNYLNILTIS